MNGLLQTGLTTEGNALFSAEQQFFNPKINLVRTIKSTYAWSVVHIHLIDIAHSELNSRVWLTFEEMLIVFFRSFLSFLCWVGEHEEKQCIKWQLFCSVSIRINTYCDCWWWVTYFPTINAAKCYREINWIARYIQGVPIKTPYFNFALISPIYVKYNFSWWKLVLNTLSSIIFAWQMIHGDSNSQD